MVVTPLCLLLLKLPAGMAQMVKLAKVWETPQPYSDNLDYDRANGRLLVTSLISNSIASLDPYNGLSLLTMYNTFDEDAIGMGIKVSKSGHVYAGFVNFMDQDDGGVAVVDLPVTDSGYAAAVPYWDSLSLPCTFLDTHCGTANDMALASDGTAYVTDSKIGRLLTVANGTIKDFSTDPALRWIDPYDPFGVDGIVLDEERGFLVVSNIASLKLLRVCLKTKEIVEIPIDGFQNPGLNGMEMDPQGRIFAIGKNNVLHILKDNDDEWRSASLVGATDIDPGVDGFRSSGFTFGENYNEGYVSFCAYGDLFTGDYKNYGLIGKVLITYDDSEEPDNAQVA